MNPLTAAASVARETIADTAFNRWARETLVWLPERGMGYREPGLGIEYGEEYFEHYAEIAPTLMGQRINEARAAMVNEFYGDGPVVDVGIGAGAFIAARPNTWGYDVNRIGQRWLERRNLWRDPYEEPVPAITLWDVLEHLPNPAALLDNVTEWVFTSLPIFRDVEHILGSKHYKPGEHLWYWTRLGLCDWMTEHGFEKAHENNRETTLGREDVLSFAFRRVG